MNMDKSKPFYILIPTSSTPCLQYAAKELGYFVSECLGVKVQTVTDESVIDGECVSLGETIAVQVICYKPDTSILKDDGFYIKTLGERIYIVGATDRGVLFGVYEFVERFLGVRFICSDTTVLPKTDTLVIEDGEICEIPAFRLRGYLEYDLYEDFGSCQNQADKVFALRQRARHSFLFPGEKFGGGSGIWGRKDTHNFMAYVDKNKYNNPDDPEYYHPEFYCCATDETNKNFEFTYADDADMTICLTNGITEDGEIDETVPISVAKVALEELKKDIVTHQNVDYFVFEQEDGNLCCQCEKCRKAEEKYKRSGMLVRFVNAIGKKLQDWSDKELNGKKIQLVTYAYSYTLQAPIIRTENDIIPIDSTVVPNENVVIRIAAGRNFFYSYFDERQRQSTRKAIEEWGAIGKKFFVWTYDAFFDRYLLYLPSEKNIKANVQGFEKFGCEYLMVQGANNANGMWQNKLRAYLYQKGMWNTGVDFDELQKEWLGHYFGENAIPYIEAFMQKYYDFYEEKNKEKPVCTIYGMRNKEDYDKDVLIETLALVREAKKLNAEHIQDPVLREKYDKHLTQAEVNSLFPLVENYFYYFEGKTQKDFIAYAKEFMRLCTYAGIQKYGEYMLDLSEWESDNYKFPY